MPVEKIASELDRIVAPGQDIEELGRGYSVAEGPVWHMEGGYLLFSDVMNSRTMKWAPGQGISVFREPTDNANGLTRDPQGRLVACEYGARRVTRRDHDGSITVVANSYQGKRLNHPNDVVVKSDGSIYFTDPGAPDPELDLDFCGVYRVSPDLGAITLLVRDFLLPNGLTFSPDESILYINDTRRFPPVGSYRGPIRAFDVDRNGALVLTSDRVFCEMRGESPGAPDGMKVDVEGNVYCTGPGGLWVLDPSGKHLGTILMGAQQTTNCAWGGDDWKTLYITTMETMARIQLKIPGIPVPAK